MHHQLKYSQKLNCTIDEAWDFITSPINLEGITPKSMSFKITSDNPEQKIYPGMIITYKVAPLLGVKMPWVTEITHCEDHKYFVDEQRLGPYKMWHHQHILEDHKTHVVMKDIITYIPPFGIIGSIANALFIRNKVSSIFDYRYKILEERFNL
jgi:ligand-binding SRPBCC domain-containing protein